MKRVYRLSAEATGPAAAARGVLTPQEVDDVIAVLTRREEDPAWVAITLPDVWAIARR